MAKPKTPMITLQREEAITAVFALRNYNGQLRQEIKKPTRPHGPAESAATLCDTDPLLERLEAWLNENRTWGGKIMAATRYDHFHATYLALDGTKHDVEGGFTGYPEGFEDYSMIDKANWWTTAANAWKSDDVPKGAFLISVRLAG